MVPTRSDEPRCYAALRLLPPFLAHALHLSSSAASLQIKCQPMTFSDNYGMSIDRTGACHNQDSIIIAITDTCPCFKEVRGGSPFPVLSPPAPHASVIPSALGPSALSAPSRAGQRILQQAMVLR